MKYLFLITLSSLFLFSCESIKVTMDYDNTVDFSKYKTYQLDHNVEELPLNDLNKTRLLNAVKSQMQEKGFSESDEPDVFVDLVLTAQQEQNTYANTNYYGGGYRYGRGGGFSTTDVNTVTYVVGTLFIDLIDAKEEKLVWQGRGEGTIDENTKNREKNINDVVKKIFYYYPPKSK